MLVSRASLPWRLLGKLLNATDPVDKQLIDKLLKVDRRFLPREIAIEDRERKFTFPSLLRAPLLHQSSSRYRKLGAHTLGYSTIAARANDGNGEVVA